MGTLTTRLFVLSINKKKPKQPPVKEPPKPKRPPVEEPPPEKPEPEPGKPVALYEQV